MSLTDKQITFIDYYKEHNCTFQEVIRETGVISHSGFYKWKKNEEFMTELLRDDERMIDDAKSVIHRAVRGDKTKGDQEITKLQVDTAKWLLERKGGYHKVASEQNINVNHKAIAQIEIPDMNNEKFAAIGEEAKTVIPTTEEDLLEMSKARFGEEFEYEFRQSDD